jgi:hypothetical protein
VRILEADGSVYEGSVLDGDLPRAKAAPRPSVEPVGRSEARRGTLSAFGFDASEANRVSVRFRVAGTNRSLNQWVVITGTLGPPPAELGVAYGANTASSRPAGATPASSPAPVVSAAPLLLRSAGKSPALAVPSPTAGEYAGPNADTPAPFPLRFRGTAIIGGTNELQIEARRVTE